MEEAARFAACAAEELVESAAIDFASDILLVGGDTAASPLLWSALFQGIRPAYAESSLGSFQPLKRLRVVACLGNHELLSASCADKDHDRNAMAFENAVSSYGGAFPWCVVTVLENALFLMKGHRETEVWGERRILEASEQELAEALHDSSIAILGGIGFTGLEPVHNATEGYYGNIVASVEEDCERSARMAAVHDKVARCASDIEVIVLTHTPAKSWLPSQPVPGWVYVSGHNHINEISKANGAKLYSDNQAGYDCARYRLKCFGAFRQYDPLKSMPDGYREIDKEQYLRFLNARDIPWDSFRTKGRIIALKRRGVYLFAFQTKKGKFSLLDGCRRRPADHELAYYWENMEQYAEAARSAFSRYRSAIGKVSEEIQAVGGSGRVHGCIVDVDAYRHVYLNPFDGTLTSYMAYDDSERFVYGSFREMVAPSARGKARLDAIGRRYLAAAEDHGTRLLETADGATEVEKPVEAILAVGREMYEPSNVMLKIQCLLDSDVLRDWHDELLAHPVLPERELDILFEELDWDEFKREHRMRPVKRCKTGKVYRSMKAAADDLGLDYPAFSRDVKRDGVHRREKWELVDPSEVEVAKEDRGPGRSTKTSVGVVCVETGQKFASLRAAEGKTGISRARITKALKTGRVTYNFLRTFTAG